MTKNQIIDPHKPGRKPVERPAAFWQGILADYERMSIAQMATTKNVSKTTINNWLRIARRKRDAGEL